MDKDIQLKSLIDVAQAINKNRVEMKKVFCDKNPVCKEKIGCCTDGIYDDIKCPLFGRNNQEIADEITFQVNTAYLLGKIT